MKFQITRPEFSKLREHFADYGNAAGFIELEPVAMTATEAIELQKTDSRAFEKGHKLGYVEGYHDGKRRDYRMGYDFGSKDGDTIVVAMKREDGSIEILKTL